MADITAICQRDRVSPSEQMRPLTVAAREAGADAVAEQRELLCVLLDQSDELSGLAKRGLLMRILALSDVAASLFNDSWKDALLDVTFNVYGDGSRASLDASEAMRAELVEVAHD